jgi:hypothetical protein
MGLVSGQLILLLLQIDLSASESDRSLTMQHSFLLWSNHTLTQQFRPLNNRMLRPFDRRRCKRFSHASEETATQIQRVQAWERRKSHRSHR